MQRRARRRRSSSTVYGEWSPSPRKRIDDRVRADDVDVVAAARGSRRPPVTDDVVGGRASRPGWLRCAVTTAG